MFKLSGRSLNILETCDKKLQMLIKDAIYATPIDFGVSCGHRSIEEQQKVFKEGKSKCDGIIHKSNHNYLPSKAVDIYPYINGKASYDKIHLSIIAGVIYTVAFELNMNIKWGGTFNSDVFNGFDMPHFQLEEK